MSSQLLLLLYYVGEFMLNYIAEIVVVKLCCCKFEVECDLMAEFVF